MKPKTTLEHTIVALSNQLPAITRRQNEMVFDKCFSNFAVRSRNSIFCLECGHSWRVNTNEKLQKVICTKCCKKLTLADNYNNGKKETDYYQIITTANDFQLVRMVCITKTMKKNVESSFFGHEVMRIFIDQNGKSRYFSKNVMGMSQYYDQWIVSSDLTLKPNVDTIRFYLSPSYILPNKKVIPNIKRNGFKGRFHGVAPQLLFKQILSDSIAETLLKSGQSDLLYYHIRNTPLKQDSIHWSALKICIRNNYTINDAKLWVDYIDLLEYFWKDVRSAKYVCPVDLEKAHNRLMQKKNEALIQDKFEKNKKEINKNQKQYLKAKKQFFGLVFTEKNISINVIESVREFLKEGTIHNHCVFTNEFYKKSNSLILSAKVNGIPMETIQLSLENFEVLQSRGKGNKASRYNKQIIEVVNKNVHKIGARIKAAS
jgi:hypothetical protein